MPATEPATRQIGRWRILAACTLVVASAGAAISFFTDPELNGIEGTEVAEITVPGSDTVTLGPGTYRIYHYIDGCHRSPDREWGALVSEALGMSHANGNGAGTSAATTPIASVAWRQRVSIEGRVRTLRVRRVDRAPSLECVSDDGTGTLSLVFLGRSGIAGTRVVTDLRAHGLTTTHRGRLAILNPRYEMGVPTA